MSHEGTLSVLLPPEPAARTRWATEELLARLGLRYRLLPAEAAVGAVALAIGRELPPGAAGVELMGTSPVAQVTAELQAGRAPAPASTGPAGRLRLDVSLEDLFEEWLAWRGACAGEWSWAESGRSGEEPAGRRELRVGRRPAADLLAEAVGAALEAAARSSGLVTPPRVPRWPDGRRFAVHLSHDVDYLDGRSLLWMRYAGWTARAGLALARGQVRSAQESLSRIRRWLGEKGDPQAGVPILMAAERAAGARSTFYFLIKTSSYSRGERIGRLYSVRTPYVRRLMAEVARSGWEVGVHGRYPTFISAAGLGREKRLLEEAAQVPVRGVRQHCLHLRLPQTFRAQEEAGFSYDATVGWNDDAGFRGGTCLPYRVWDAEARRPLRLWEIPLTFQDVALQHARGPVAGWTPALAPIRRDIERLGGVLSASFHTNWVDPVDFPGALDWYRDLLAELGEAGGWLTHGADIVQAEESYRRSLAPTE